MDKIKTIAELKALCKERKIKGFSGKTKKELCDLLGAGEPTVPPDPLPATENHIISPVTEAQAPTALRSAKPRSTPSRS